MKRILITGANSYIGTSFEKYLAEHYPDVYTVDTVDMIGDGWKEKDFSGFDSIFHVAGIVHQKETKENIPLYDVVNRALPVEVAQKAKAAGVKQFVFLSTMSVYGMDTGTITPDTLPKPKTYYGRSKLQAEAELSALGDDGFFVAILRPPMVYGKGCKGNYQSLRALALKLPVFPYVKNKRSMIYIDNLSEYVRQAIDDSWSGTHFPQNGEYTNTSEMAKAIMLAHCKKPHMIRGFGWLIKLCGLLSGKLRKAFGTLVYERTLSSSLSDGGYVELKTSIELTEAHD